MRSAPVAHENSQRCHPWMPLNRTLIFQQVIEDGTCWNCISWLQFQNHSIRAECEGVYRCRSFQDAAKDSDRHPCSLCNQANSRILHAKGQICPADISRQDLSNYRGIPSFGGLFIHQSSLRLTSFNFPHFCSEFFHQSQDIHPFYADLINVLYDRDHYKLALGQINVARHLIDNLAKDYVRLLKYGDSLYRCKQLKRAALGRYVLCL